jgi:hypothetical protein
MTYMRIIPPTLSTEEDWSRAPATAPFNGFVEMDNDFTHTPTERLNAAR